MADWKDELPEEIKSAGELKDIGSVEKLSESYISLTKAFSSRTDGVKADEDFDISAEKWSKFNSLPKEEKDYKVDVKDNQTLVQRAGFKYKMHPRQAKGFSEEYHKGILEIDKKLSAQERENLKEESNKAFKDIKDRDTLISKAANASGHSVDELKGILGNKFYSPKVQKLLMDYAKHLDAPVGEKPPVSSKPALNEASAQEKLNWISETIKNTSSPYYDKTHADHITQRQRMEKYKQDLRKYEQETGEKVQFFT